MNLHYLVPCTSSKLPQKPSESRPCIYYKLLLAVIGILDYMIVPNKLKHDELKYDGRDFWLGQDGIGPFLLLPAKHNRKHWK